MPPGSQVPPTPVRAAPKAPMPLPAHELTAYPLRFEGRADRPISLNEHKGSAIRGALFHALRGKPDLGGGFCVRQDLTSCHPCDLHAVCPISALVATVSVGGPRGVDPPRPFTIEPPLDGNTQYATGSSLRFGLTVFGDAVALLPYVVSAARDLQRTGIGRGGWDTRGQIRRGTFLLERLVACNPLTGSETVLWTTGEAAVRPVRQVVTGAQACETADKLDNASAVTLDFLTPTRLTDRGQLVRQPVLRPLLQRLIERSLALAGAEVDVRPYAPLLLKAESAQVVEDATRWVELDSYSTRRNAHAPLSGLVGRVTFSGDLEGLLPWLVWGQLTHVGKEATKGNGWYRVQ